MKAAIGNFSGGNAFLDKPVSNETYLVGSQKLRVLVAALWDKKLAFRTLFTARVSEGIAIFESRAAIEFSFGEKERPAHRRSNLSIVFTARVSEGIAIFGSRAAIEFSFGEKERPAQRRSNLSIVLTARECPKGKRFSEAVLRLNSASEKKSVLLKEDQTDL
ncbi:hypothetical protein TNCV_3659171 [Trichonephila clavipes]|nr:hypothetical protein TNCV_3659171 [Trichonephila clavipes]